MANRNTLSEEKAKILDRRLTQKSNIILLHDLNIKDMSINVPEFFLLAPSMS